MFADATNRTALDVVKRAHIVTEDMTGLLRRSLLLLLACGTFAAQALCACPTSPEFSKPVAQDSRPCKGKAKCCLKDEASTPAPAPPKKDAPCDRCNLMHRADQIHPDRQVDADAVHPFCALVPVPLFHMTGIEDRLPQWRDSERVPIPPLLRDLFHSRTLLLV